MNSFEPCLRHGSARHAAHVSAPPLQVYEALNALGETAWSINEDVLEAVEHAYQVEGGGMAGLPLHTSKGEPAVVPERPPLRYRTEAKHGRMIAAVSWTQPAGCALRAAGLACRTCWRTCEADGGVCSLSKLWAC